MTPSRNVRLQIGALPENVALVREVLAGIGDVVDLGGALEDIKAAVSEAANNVVMHAYGGDEGPMEVEVSLGERELEVVVRDHGTGIGPRPVDDSFPGKGIGLAVIGALAASSELRAHEDGGLEVTMRFAIPERRGLPSAGAPPGGRTAEPGTLTLRIAPASLSAAILNRVVTTVAARAGFSIDRVSDAQLVADALAAALAASLVDDCVSVVVELERGRVLLTVGPLRDGGSKAVLAGSSLADLGPIIERLVDGSSSDRDGSGEMLSLVMADRRPPA
jgi:serine/threonine-protein kinase RsbW